MLQVDEARDILATVVLAHVPVCPLHARPNHGHPLHCQCYWEPRLWGCFWSLLDCQAVSPSILIFSRWLSVAKDLCVYPCMVSGSRYIISWIDTGLVNPCRVPTLSNFVAGSWQVWVKLGVSCMSVVVRQRVNVEYNGTVPSWLALFVWCRSTSLNFDPNAYI